ncbi:unnamed protein product [Mytilus coruscus]|uniref:Uncharacterized protein n=1 Tax=Mytilus coruscus TaxID=42192 RepID=A0A6J8AZR4_MYTCO|nr:unnamed protein product [Mytilus coruscus]
MILYDLYYIRTQVWIIFLFILFRCTDFIQGTSIQILNATCPRSPSCNNVTIAICTGGCDNANSTCFSSKFEPNIGYKHVFKCSEKFINVIVAKVYFGKENYTLCEDEKGRKSQSDTCLKHPNAICRLDNHLQAHNVYNNYSFEVKIGDECTEFHLNIVPYILTGVGVAVLVLTAVIIFFNRKVSSTKYTYLRNIFFLAALKTTLKSLYEAEKKSNATYKKQTDKHIKFLTNELENKEQTLKQQSESTKKNEILQKEIDCAKEELSSLKIHIAAKF